jgi:hypothetical protein
MSTAFLATYSDGYKRTIAHPKIKTMLQAFKHAKELETWYEDPARKLVDVQVKH